MHIFVYRLLLLQTPSNWNLLIHTSMEDSIVANRPQGKLLFSKRLYNLVDNNFTVSTIIFFEFFGTAFFSYGVLTGLNGNFTASILAGTFQSVWIPLCLFLMISWCARFTRAHFNPAVTLGHMLRRTKPLPWTQGLIYFAAEMFGALLGTTIAWQVNVMSNSAPWRVTFADYSYVWQAFRGEVFGTFMLVLFVMISSQPDTTPCGSVLQGNMFMPMILLCSFAISFQLLYCIYEGNWGVWAYVWSTFLGPFVGSILAVVFYEYVYTKFLYTNTSRLENKASRSSFMEVELS